MTELIHAVGQGGPAMALALIVIALSYKCMNKIGFEFVNAQKNRQQLSLARHKAWRDFTALFTIF